MAVVAVVAVGEIGTLVIFVEGLLFRTSPPAYSLQRQAWPDIVVQHWSAKSWDFPDFAGH